MYDLRGPYVLVVFGLLGVAAPLATLGEAYARPAAPPGTAAAHYALACAASLAGGASHRVVIKNVGKKPVAPTAQIVLSFGNAPSVSINLPMEVAPGKLVSVTLPDMNGGKPLGACRAWLRTGATR